MRDFQRSKVYAAEDKAFAEWKLPEWESMDECRAFIQVITSSHYWQRHKGWKRITLKDGRGCRSASYWRGKIYRYGNGTVKRVKVSEMTLPKWSRNKFVIIHESAHWLTDRTTEDSTSHGSHFAGHYLNLIDELIGTDAAMGLMASFEEKGVKYHLQ